MITNHCDNCGRKGKLVWVLIDGDSESELCRPCYKELKEEAYCTVEPLLSL